MSETQKSTRPEKTPAERGEQVKRITAKLMERSAALDTSTRVDSSRNFAGYPVNLKKAYGEHARPVNEMEVRTGAGTDGQTELQITQPHDPNGRTMIKVFRGQGDRPGALKYDSGTYVDGSVLRGENPFDRSDIDSAVHSAAQNLSAVRGEIAAAEIRQQQVAENDHVA